MSAGDLLDLPCWADSLPADDARGSDTGAGRPDEASPLPFFPAVNRRLSVVRGDVLALRCDALVVSNNELLGDLDGIPGRAFLLAGGELFRAQCRADLESVRTGEAKVSVPGVRVPRPGQPGAPGGDTVVDVAPMREPSQSQPISNNGDGDDDAEPEFDVDTQLFCTHLVHTVGPRYNPKYAVAAESALHTSYRIALQLSVAAGARTIALSPISSVRRNYPARDAAHVAARTLRRFIENHGGDVDRVAFVLDNQEDLDLYTEIFALYFPRSASEEHAAVDSLPAILGDPVTGEIIIEERQIRIRRNPIDRPEDSESDGEDYSDSSDSEVEGEDVDDVRELLSRSGLTRMHRSRDEALRAAILSKRTGPAPHIPHKMDHPEERQMGAVRATESVDFSNLSSEELVARAMQANVDEAEKWGFMKVAKLPVTSRSVSNDCPRRVVVVTGCCIPEDADMTQVLLYSLRTMNGVVGEPYSLLYCHSEMENRETPSFDWLRTLHRVFDAQCGHNIRHFFILHGTFWLKMFFAVTGPFLSANFKRVKKNCGGLREVVDEFASVGFPAYALKEALPPQVFSWDTHLTGVDWSSATHAHDEL
jgi:ganglioside-induced differentiation-associated protein 2